MITMTQLSEISQSFVSYMSIGMRAKNPVSVIAIAKALADRVPLPSGQVDNIEQFYKTTIQLSVIQKLDKLNELLMVKCDDILDLTARFYRVRYNVAYPTRKAFCIRSETVVEDFLGASMALDQGSVEEIKKSPLELTKIYNDFNIFLDDIEKTEGA